jgi:hypothetical protein
MMRDSRPILPRPAGDPEYLNRLRQRAMAQLQREEQAALLVTRRWSLQRFAIIVAGLTPAIGTLLRAKSAFAAPVGARCNAPQYGAPGMPGNPPRNPESIPSSFITRPNLKSLDSWTKAKAQLVTAGSPEITWGTNTEIRLAYYRLPSGDPLLLAVIADAKSHNSYVVDANQVFYVFDGTDLLGCKFGYAELVVTPSIFKIRTPPDGDAGVVAQFAATVDDKALAAAAAPDREVHISLTKDVPPDFWGADAPGSPRKYYPYLYKSGIVDGVLQFSGEGPGHGFGTFWVDLKSKKLVKFRHG